MKSRLSFCLNYAVFSLYFIKQLLELWTCFASPASSARLVQIWSRILPPAVTPGECSSYLVIQGQAIESGGLSPNRPPSLPSCLPSPGTTLPRLSLDPWRRLAADPLHRQARFPGPAPYAMQQSLDPGSAPSTHCSGGGWVLPLHLGLLQPGAPTHSPTHAGRLPSRLLSLLGTTRPPSPPSPSPPPVHRLGLLILT